ncbi:vegetative incompatibility protein HET-E-1, partial [Mycena filopes]
LNNWLHPAQISVSQCNALNQRHPARTGSWLLALPAFKEWIYTPRSLLWLHGISGCGKTILRSFSHSVCRTLPNVSYLCTYFYFETNNPDQNTVTHLLSSLVTQLSVQAHLPDEKLKALWKSYNNGQQLTAHQCVALDGHVNKDIELHLNEWLSEQNGWIHDNRELVKSKVLERSSGMFRLLTLHLDEITACAGRPNKIQETLARMPKSMHNKYTQIMESFGAEMLADISRAMNWLIYAQRLLAPAELVDALAMDFTKEPLHFDRNNRYGSPEAFLALCAGFIMFSEESSIWGPQTIVKLAHASVKEYFLSTTCLHVSKQAAHYLIARTCIGYLLSLDRPLKTASSCGNIEVACLLLDHGADVNAPPGECGTALQAAVSHGKVEVAHLLLHHGADVNAPPGERYGTALQAASFRGEVTVARLLLEHGADVNTRGEQYGTALQAASYRGNIEVARLLLDHGADVNAPPGEQYGTALQAASFRGEIKVACLLLDHGADVNTRGERYGTALQAASYRGNIEVACLLLDHGADVNAPPGEQYGTALQAASLCGKTKVTRLLLEHGADVNAPPGERYGTALQAASLCGKVKVIHLLLENGADVNRRGERYGTALLAASWHNHIEVVRLLLDHGADVNAWDEQYGTALQITSFCGNIEVARLLLDHGADVNTRPAERYGTALQAASRRNHIKVARLLLDHGADVNARGGRLAVCWGLPGTLECGASFLRWVLRWRSELTRTRTLQL